MPGLTLRTFISCLISWYNDHEREVMLFEFWIIPAAL